MEQKDKIMKNSNEITEIISESNQDFCLNN